MEISDTGVGTASDLLAKNLTPLHDQAGRVGHGTRPLDMPRHRDGRRGAHRGRGRPGRGSTFRVWFPATAADHAPPESTGGGADPGRRRAAVLLVDDEPQIVKVLTLLLDPYHDVTSEQRADAALRRIAGGERFDVILCDLMMPQMTGMDLHDSLRSVASIRPTRCCFLTGGASTPRAREFIGRLPEGPIEEVDRSGGAARPPGPGGPGRGSDRHRGVARAGVPRRRASRRLALGGGPKSASSDGFTFGRSHAAVRVADASSRIITAYLRGTSMKGMAL